MISGVPEAGDVVWIDFEPQAGTEIKKRRPGLVLSPLSFNQKIGQAWICPITSKPPRHNFQIPLPEGIEGFEYPTEPGEIANVKIEQLRSLDFRARKAEFITRVPQGFLAQCKSFAVRVIT